MNVAFVDTETTGLDPERNPIWEIAVIIPDGPDAGEHVWQQRLPFHAIKPTHPIPFVVVDDGTHRVEHPGEYVIVHSGRLAELFGKWVPSPEDGDQASVALRIGDDYEALLRSTPTLLVTMLDDALALPERTCVEDRVVDL